jgi:hypothetical protein
VLEKIIRSNLKYDKLSNEKTHIFAAFDIIIDMPVCLMYSIKSCAPIFKTPIELVSYFMLILNLFFIQCRQFGGWEMVVY